MINYKFNESALINELQYYVDATYDEHYAKNNFQSAEFIMDCGHGMGFFLGNVLKYAQRYGSKDGYNRKDIFKILHYALLALNEHDISHKTTEVFSNLDFPMYSDIDSMYNNYDYVTTTTMSENN